MVPHHETDQLLPGEPFTSRERSFSLVYIDYLEYYVHSRNSIESPITLQRTNKIEGKSQNTLLVKTKGRQAGDNGNYNLRQKP